jgi:hypothetical protein
MNVARLLSDGVVNLSLVGARVTEVEEAYNFLLPTEIGGNT